MLTKQRGKLFGAAAGVDLGELRIIKKSGSSAASGTTSAIVNAASTTAGFFDNLLVTATNVDLLGVNEIAAADLSVAAFPNPVKDHINISGTMNNGINTVTLTDINGRNVKQKSFDSTADAVIDMTDVAAGIYMMKIDTQTTSIVKKIIKN